MDRVRIAMKISIAMSRYVATKQQIKRLLITLQYQV